MARFVGRKVYGESKVSTCTFCGAAATAITDSGLVVCRHHKDQKLEEIKCTCGSWLEQRAGKFGPYFNCLNCGNVNFNKAMEMKAVMPKSSSVATTPRQVSSYKTTSKKEETFEERERRLAPKKEITITSDDVQYFD